MLPHKVYEEDKFFSETKVLRSRFDIENEKTLFPSSDVKSVPMDGLPIFIDQTWEKIRTQKELNLPDQKAMVANFRCNELRQEAIDAIGESSA